MNDDIVCGLRFAGATAKPLPFPQRVQIQIQPAQTTTSRMGAQGYRKIELQSPADFTYLYTNAVALSRQKLDLNFPPLATDDDTPDPMRERVQELVNEVSQALILQSKHHAVGYTSNSPGPGTNKLSSI